MELGMAKVKLTAGRVAEFTCTKGNQAFLWDTDAKGLALRVTPNNSKSYIHQGKLNGRDVRITIGNVKSWGIDDARIESRALQTMLDKGVDPREQRRDLAASAEANKVERVRRSATFGDAWQAYVEANQPSWGERHLADHIRLSAAGGEKRRRRDGLTISGPLRVFFLEPLPALTGERIASWLQKESITRPTSAAQSYRLLRAFIRWADGKAEYKGLIPSDAYSASDVRKAIPKGGAKDDCLQREQLAGWFDAVRKIHNPVISAYLQALLITGARRDELLSLRWENIDFKWKTLTIRDKVEGQRVIPLTPYVSSLLLDLMSRNATPPTSRHLRKMAERGEEFKPSPWVFYSRTAEDGRLAEPRPAHMQALQIAGLPHLTLHGLRRSFGTLCEWVEVPTGISAQIMGHKPTALAEKHYRRRPIDLLRMWHERIESWMLEQAGVNPS
jgi:integrase